MPRLKEKVAIITGGASGFGEATARLFSKEGAHVVITDIDEQRGRDVAGEIDALFIQHDVAAETGWASVIQTVVNSYEQIDVLVNNAGIHGSGEPQDIESITVEEWRMIQQVNLDSVMLGCQKVIPAMARKNRGSIINIASLASMWATPTAVAYGASKGAIRQLTKSVAAHCARKGYSIRCNSIHPGVVRTSLGDGFLSLSKQDLEQAAEIRMKRVPLGSLGTVDDIAYAALFLGSDESRFITGSELVIDGGVLTGG